MIAIFSKSRERINFNLIPANNFKHIRSVNDVRGLRFDGVVYHADWYKSGEDVQRASELLKERQPELYGYQDSITDKGASSGYNPIVVRRFGFVSSKDESGLRFWTRNCIMGRYIEVYHCDSNEYSVAIERADGVRVVFAVGLSLDNAFRVALPLVQIHHESVVFSNDSSVKHK